MLRDTVEAGTFGGSGPFAPTGGWSAPFDKPLSQCTAERKPADGATCGLTKWPYQGRCRTPLFGRHRSPRSTKGSGASLAWARSAGAVAGAGLHGLQHDGDNEPREMTDRERAALAAEIASAVAGATAPHSCSCESPAQAAGSAIGAQNGFSECVDLSLSRPNACRSEVQDFLASARTAGYRSVCVPQRWTAMAVRALADRPIKVASVVGYPNGASLTPVKCKEAECLMRLGADELWMVADTAGLRSGDLDAAFVDIRAVAELAQCRGALLNVVLELPLLTARQKLEACVVAKLAGAAAAVSATGWNGSVADTSDIELMRRTVGGDLDIVAAGGIRTESDARRMLIAGATRIGAGRELALSISRSA